MGRPQMSVSRARGRQNAGPNPGPNPIGGKVGEELTLRSFGSRRVWCVPPRQDYAPANHGLQLRQAAAEMLNLPDEPWDCDEQRPEHPCRQCEAIPRPTGELSRLSCGPRILLMLPAQETVSVLTWFLSVVELGLAERVQERYARGNGHPTDSAVWLLVLMVPGETHRFDGPGSQFLPTAQTCLALFQIGTDRMSDIAFLPRGSIDPDLPAWRSRRLPLLVVQIAQRVPGGGLFLQVHVEDPRRPLCLGEPRQLKQAN